MERECRPDGDVGTEVGWAGGRRGWRWNRAEGKEGAGEGRTYRSRVRREVDEIRHTHIGVEWDLQTLHADHVCVCRSRVRDGEMDTDMPNARGKRETPVTGWFHYALRIPHVNG